MSTAVVRTLWGSHLGFIGSSGCSRWKKFTVFYQEFVKLVLWGQSTTKDYISAKNRLQSAYKSSNHKCSQIYKISLDTSWWWLWSLKHNKHAVAAWICLCSINIHHHHQLVSWVWLVLCAKWDYYACVFLFVNLVNIVWTHTHSSIPRKWNIAICTSIWSGRMQKRLCSMQCSLSFSLSYSAALQLMCPFLPLLISSLLIHTIICAACHHIRSPWCQLLRTPLPIVNRNGLYINSM